MKSLKTNISKPTETHAQKLLFLLQERECIDEEGMKLVSRLQRKSRFRPITLILQDAGVDEEAIQRAVADVSKLLFSRIEKTDVIEELVDKLGLGWCKDHSVLPVSIDGKTYIASKSVDELFLTNDIRAIAGSSVGQMLATARDIQTIINQLNAKVESTNKPSCQDDEADFFADGDTAAEAIDLEETAADADSSPVVRLVGEMITNAVREDASDIHFEAGTDCSHIRFRIDGVLHDLMESPKRLHGGIVSRIKILSNLDIAERRLPQDGRIRATVLGRSIDLRVSTVPTPKGEKVVMRLLDNRNIRIGLDELGFRNEALDLWKHEIESPHGIILVTGPTGCGKTTTLYSSLQEMDRKRLNISTVEDPVEYELAGITQIQVHDKIDMTFSRALRALLRQDPDVVLLGEIRDMDTANVAIQAAMTGHLVLSTLHTNDAPSSLTRLINIGIEPFLVASAVNGVLAQRLARRVCKKCVEFKKPTKKEMQLLDGHEYTKIPYAAGCSVCRGSGYNGRIGIYELLVMDDELRDAIASNPTITSFRNLAIERGMQILRHDGFAKVAAGLTTIEEILRLTP
ncbi:MAG: GspE/PulE family protein [Phycisphaerales bacterium]|nr:GspE/PulE family protein [Phycisphaerales bacterium]